MHVLFLAPLAALIAAAPIRLLGEADCSADLIGKVDIAFGTCYPWFLPFIATPAALCETCSTDVPDFIDFLRCVGYSDPVANASGTLRVFPNATAEFFNDNACSVFSFATDVNSTDDGCTAFAVSCAVLAGQLYDLFAPLPSSSSSSAAPVSASSSSTGSASAAAALVPFPLA